MEAMKKDADKSSLFDFIVLCSCDTAVSKCSCHLNFILYHVTVKWCKFEINFGALSSVLICRKIF